MIANLGLNSLCFLNINIMHRLEENYMTYDSISD